MSYEARDLKDGRRGVWSSIYGSISCVRGRLDHWNWGPPILPLMLGGQRQGALSRLQVPNELLLN